MIAGIDYSTRFVDVVLLDEDTDAATWHRFELVGDGTHGAFDRAREVGLAFPHRAASFWDEVLAIGIEDPRGFNSGALYRIQGAILCCIPHTRLVQPWIPSAWRKTVGLPGNASKEDVWRFAHPRLIAASSWYGDAPWTQDGMDAYCIALATRMSVQVTA